LKNEKNFLEHKKGLSPVETTKIIERESENAASSLSED